MIITIRNILLSFVFFAFSTLAGNAQQLVAIAPQPTISECSDGAGAETTCVNPTQIYMNDLVAQALPEEQFSQALADFVINLAALAQADEVCNIIDLEIASAIKLAASYAIDPEQRAQLIGIGDTIGGCEDFQTAAIGPVVSPN